MLRCCGLLLATSGLLLGGCVASYYVPNSVNVPLLTEKKDARASVHYYSTSRDFFNTLPGLEIQGSYAPASHLGLMGSFLTTGKTKEGARISALYGDMGVGYFYATENQHWVAECYGGAGMGTVKNSFSDGTSGVSGFTKYFIQPSLGFRSKYFEAAFAWRMASVHHTSLEVSSMLTEFQQRETDWIRSHPIYTVHEPALTFRFGDDPFKAQIQQGYSVSMNRADPRYFFNIALVVSLPWKKYKTEK